MRVTSGPAGTADAAVSGDAALRELEGGLDSWGARLATHALVARRSRPRPRPERSIAEELTLAAHPSAQPAALLAASMAAARAGALTSAEAFLERLRDRSAELRPSQSMELLACEVELRLVRGELTTAAELSTADRVALCATPRGRTLLSLLGEPSSGWLPDGAPDLVGLSRRIAAGRLKAEELAGLLGSSRRRWLRTPELLLLFWSTLWPEEPARALRFMNRFLELNGAPTLVGVSSAAENALGRVQSRRATPRAGGPLVSIVVAAHNAMQTLPYALESLLGQTHGACEVLLGDDGSDDGTLESMLRYASDARVRVFRSVRNQGAYNLRNALAARARGEIFAFQDADDLALSTRIERQLDCLRRTGAVACATSWLRLRSDGGVVFFKDQKAMRLSRISLMLRADAFNAVGRFRPARFGADEELYARLIERYGPSAIARVRAPLILSAWSASSITRRPGSEALENGYRSPGRRSYSEMIFRRYARGSDLTDEAISGALAESGNFAPPQELEAVRP